MYLLVKMCWATFWAFFQKNHLVTLVSCSEPMISINKTAANDNTDLSAGVSATRLGDISQFGNKLTPKKFSF
jgi:hypothetical protein